MTYELAKQLKDAGFPQKITAGAGDGHLFQDEVYGIAYAPTLSELIEACGQDLWILKRGSYMGEFGWIVGQDRKEEDNPAYWFLFRFGKTPEEAVAKLWLALNKKNAIRPNT